MNRRDFLHPRRLARSASAVLGTLDAQNDTDVVLGEQEAWGADELTLLRVARQAMATTFEVVLPFGIPDAQAAALAAFDEIDRLEAQLTVYHADSEVSRLNSRAANRDIPVEEKLFRLLELAKRIYTETQGAFDITAGALVKAWGFHRGPRRVPSDAERARAMHCIGMGHVFLDAQKRTVRYHRLGLEINLGSIGKGFALDCVAELMRQQWHLPCALLQGGTSSVYAMGSPPGNGRDWTVGLRHPWERRRRLATLRLRNRGLGTSAATFRYLEHQGRKLGHILDPRTGWPAEGMASVSVIAPTAAEADALATAFFIQGVEGARAYCDRHPEIGAVLLPEKAAMPIILGLAESEIDVLPPC